MTLEKLLTTTPQIMHVTVKAKVGQTKYKSVSVFFCPGTVCKNAKMSLILQLFSYSKAFLEGKDLFSNLTGRSF